MLGTPLYMSPEQAQGAPLDHRTDIYSLGASFYHLLTGEAPFESDTPVALALHHVRSPLTPVKERNPRVPAPVAAIIEKMLAKDPGERYATYGDLIASLERAKAGLPPAEAASGSGWRVLFETPAGPRAPRREMDRRWLAGLLSGAALTGAVVLGILAWRSQAGGFELRGEAHPASPPSAARREAARLSPPPGGASRGDAPRLAEPPEGAEGPGEGESLPDDLPAGHGEVSRIGRRAQPGDDEALRPAPGSRQPAPPQASPGGDQAPNFDPAAFLQRAHAVASMANIKALATAIEAFRAERGELPADLGELAAEFGLHPKALLDGWKRDIRYARAGTPEYRLISAGADGEFGSSDDLVLEDGFFLDEPADGFSGLR
jgi:hypothetical protein